MRVALLFAAAFFCSDAAAADPVVEFPKSDPKPAKEAPGVQGYYLRKMSGFSVYVSKMAHEQSDELEGRPLGMIEQDLKDVVASLPPKTIAALTRVPIWVEWDHTVPGKEGVLANYHPSDILPQKMLADGTDPRKYKCPVITSLKRCYEERSSGKSKQNFTIYGLAAAVLDQLVGINNGAVKNAYEQSVTKKLYKNVRYVDLHVADGRASLGRAAYFTELSCAYLGEINYEPRDRVGLKKYDPVGYELMTKVWGTPEEIEERKQDKPKKK